MLAARTHSNEASSGASIKSVPAKTDAFHTQTYKQRRKNRQSYRACCAGHGDMRRTFIGWS